MMERLLELAAQCEAATGPDRELDVRIAKAVKRYGSVVLGSSEVKFTHSLDAAMTLVPQSALRVQTDWFPEQGIHSASINAREFDGASSASTALALCAAALRARAQPDNSNDQ